MENRLTITVEARARPALSALFAILAITVAWWVLALWPVDNTTAPEWLTRTRAVCFGAYNDGLPNAGGWLLLIGQPLGMLLVLFFVWGREVRAGFARLGERFSGQLAIGAGLALLVMGATGVVMRVRSAGAQPFASSPTEEVARNLTRVNDAAPALSLIDQHSRIVGLEAFRGRPVIVTFAYAHCETVCPLIVHDVLSAARALPLQKPAVLIVTLDPWRDTPGRLSTIASQWGVSGDAHVLSGDPEVVERALNAWRIPRVRNEKTGDLVHPSVVYIVGRNGRIAYVVQGRSDVIRAAVEAL